MSSLFHAQLNQVLTPRYENVIFIYFTFSSMGNDFTEETGRQLYKVQEENDGLFSFSLEMYPCFSMHLYDFHG